LDPGTTLRFGYNNLLFANGPLDFQGTADAPILLQPVADQWSGVVVLQADGPSAWNYVTVERASAVDQDGWTLTGGVTFYESPIRLEHSRILDSQAEDGINVIRTEFAFVQSEFAHTASDAFDADFAQGVVEECTFYDIGGDGIDVSGSDVQVRRVRLLDIGDKGISVGEASRLTAQDVHFENVTFGLVSKDLSHATLDGATIVNARRAGLAAYVKKPAYGPASLDARSITFVDTPPERHTLVQTGSWIDLEGTRIWGVDFDVEGW
ncbi:MAG: right-handed parallel beta-helix repeat-containing protein, partial [Anaerolineae bacterium]